jgi:hypothetical protein
MSIDTFITNLSEQSKRIRAYNSKYADVMANETTSSYNKFVDYLYENLMPIIEENIKNNKFSIIDLPFILRGRQHKKYIVFDACIKQLSSDKIKTSDFNSVFEPLLTKYPSILKRDEIVKYEKKHIFSQNNVILESVVPLPIVKRLKARIRKYNPNLICDFKYSHGNKLLALFVFLETDIEHLEPTSKNLFDRWYAFHLVNLWDIHLYDDI